MKHTSIISMKYLLSALAITLFLLLSCGVAESTSPSGTSPGVSTSKYMSFALSNEGRPVGINTELDRASTYQLNINPTNDAPLLTANYNITVTPADAITTNNTRSSSNKIDFIVNNTDARSVTITVSHKEDKDITDTLVLKLAPRADFMSFALSNNGRPVDTSAELTRASTYGLTINPTSDAPLLTANYDIEATPADAITINNTSPNSIVFMVRNTDVRSVTITATHKDNPAITKTLELKLAPPADLNLMSFTLSDNGDALSTSTKLARAKNYVLTVKRESGAPLQTANYNFAVTPEDAITIDTGRSSSNKIDFTVNNTAATSVTITATHKDNPVITKTLTLNLAPQADFMSFTLSDTGGGALDISTALTRAGNYVVTAKRESGAALTADYNFVVNPSDAITIDTGRSSSNEIRFRVNNTSDMTVTITAVHKDNPVITKTLRLSLASAVVTTFQQDIENAATVPDLAIANVLTREVLDPLGANAGATLVKRYATSNGGGSYDGSSWANAWAATNLRNGINAIADASASKVYLIMIAGGTYKPTYDTTRAISFSMKNHVAIMGGFKAGGGWERTGTTLMSGDIGTTGSTNDNSYHVFYHNNISLDNSHLYGVTITNGNAANGNTSDSLLGGGMYNASSSPNLTKVTFSGNTASSGGGGMYNNTSSPIINNTVFSGNSATKGGGMYNASSSPNLTKVTFSGNTVSSDGGGMFNSSASSPVINNTVFSGNSATTGGGMYNNTSSPVINNTVFSGNTASSDGGGMFNLSSSSPVINNTVFSGNSANKNGGGISSTYYSSPVLVGTVFIGNSAVNGGGMANDNNGGVGQRILNTIFSGNTTNNGNGAGPDIAMDFSGTGAENITIAGSVLGTYLTTGQPTNAIVGFNGSGNININYHHLKNGTVNFGADATTGGLTYPTIGAGSSAINLGVFVRRSGTTYYFSEDNATWYTGFSATGGWGSSGTLPANAEDLTARDITGKARTGRPDAGVFELP